MSETEKEQIARLTKLAEGSAYGGSLKGLVSGSWRDRSNVILTAADKVIPAGTPSRIRKQVYSGLWTWGERAMHPYKIWCDEVNEFMARHHPDEFRSKKTPRAKRMAANQTEPEGVLSFAF